MKKKVFNYYKKYFRNKIFQLNTTELNSQSTYWMSTLNIRHLSLKKNFKERLITFCLNKNIHLRPFFYPLSSMPMYKTKKELINRVSDRLSKSSINLPSGYNLKEKDVKRVYDTVIKFLKKEKLPLSKQI